MSIAKNVFLMGGVGNQLFQIARACSHRDNGHDVYILKLSRHTKLIYRLIGFTHHDDWIDIDKVLCKLSFKRKEISYKQILILVILFMLRKLGINKYFDTKIDEAPNFLNKFIDVGYYQSSKHLTSNAVKDVGYALIDILNISSDTDNSSMVLHIRGGDFSEKDRLKDHDIKKVKDFAQRRNLQINIVTNDKIFAKKVTGINENISINNSNSALEDFIFLTESKLLFLSNSTFAFWAATIASLLRNAELFASDNFPYKSLVNIKDIGSSI